MWPKFARLRYLFPSNECDVESRPTENIDKDRYFLLLVQKIAGTCDHWRQFIASWFIYCSERFSFLLFWEVGGWWQGRYGDPLLLLMVNPVQAGRGVALVPRGLGGWWRGRYGGPHLLLMVNPVQAGRGVAMVPRRVGGWWRGWYGGPHLLLQLRAV